MIWNRLAHGNEDYCAILVIINSILQIILYSPMSVFFINIISRSDNAISLRYGDTAIAVLIYLGIPLGAGVLTRFGGLWVLGKKRFDGFLAYFGMLSLVALLYTYVFHPHLTYWNLRTSNDFSYLESLSSSPNNPTVSSTTLAQHSAPLSL